MTAFAAVLQDAGIVTTVRKTRGDDIDAACGQLAGEVQDRTRVRARARVPRDRAMPPRPASRDRMRADCAGAHDACRPGFAAAALRSLACLLAALLAAARQPPAPRCRAAGTEPRTASPPPTRPTPQRRARVAHGARVGLLRPRPARRPRSTRSSWRWPPIPTYGEAYNLRGLIYASLGDDALAEESFRRALQLNPRDADTMHNYGWYLCQQKRFAEADALFDQALAVPQYRERRARC